MNPISGKRVCVTGVIMGMPRIMVAKAIAKLGGEPVSSVGSTTDLLVIGDRPGAIKVNDSTKYMVQTMTQNEFLNIIQLGDGSYANKPVIKTPAEIPDHYGDW